MMMSIGRNSLILLRSLHERLLLSTGEFLVLQLKNDHAEN